ncbi:MAG TPA: TonB C-terminal domain-containing protein [Trichormus sp.]|jgi:hypothetical protein
MSAITSNAYAAPAHHAPSKPAPAKAAPGNAAMSQAMNGYLNRLRAKLQSNWLMPDGDNRVTITLDLGPDGGVNSVKAESTPKCDPAEQSASDAVSKAEPFEALPSGLSQGAFVILTFLSKVDPHGDSSSNILTKMDPHPAPKPEAPASTQTDSK